MDSKGTCENGKMMFGTHGTLAARWLVFVRAHIWRDTYKTLDYSLACPRAAVE